MSTYSQPENSPSTAEASFAAFFQLFASVRGTLDEALRKESIGLSLMHLALLKYCQAHPGCSQQALAQAVGRDKGQIARLIKEFEEQGLLTREQDAEDRRSQCLHLTAKAEAACEQFSLQESIIARRMFGALSDAERTQFVAFLAAMTAGLQADKA